MPSHLPYHDTRPSGYPFNCPWHLANQSEGRRWDKKMARMASCFLATDVGALQPLRETISEDDQCPHPLAVAQGARRWTAMRAPLGPDSWLNDWDVKRLSSRPRGKITGTKMGDGRQGSGWVGGWGWGGGVKQGQGKVDIKDCVIRFGALQRDTVIHRHSRLFSVRPARVDSIWPGCRLKIMIAIPFQGVTLSRCNHFWWQCHAFLTFVSLV